MRISISVDERWHTKSYFAEAWKTTCPIIWFNRKLYTEAHQDLYKKELEFFDNYVIMGWEIKQIPNTELAASNFSVPVKATSVGAEVGVEMLPPRGLLWSHVEPLSYIHAEFFRYLEGNLMTMYAEPKKAWKKLMKIKDIVFYNIAGWYWGEIYSLWQAMTPWQWVGVLNKILWSIGLRKIKWNEDNFETGVLELVGITKVRVNRLVGATDKNDALFNVDCSDRMVKFKRVRNIR